MHTIIAFFRSSNRQLAAAMLCTILMLGTMPGLMGCNASSVAKVVSEIATYASEAEPIIADVITVITALSASDSTTSTTVSTVGATIKTKLESLVTLCNTYTSNPSTSVWSQITSLVDDLVTNGDSALTTLAGIKSSTSQQKAVVLMASLDAILHTVDGLVQSTQSTSAVKATAARRAAKLKVVSQYWSEQDKTTIAKAFGSNYSTLYSHEIAMGF